MSSNTLSFDPREWDMDDLWDGWFEEGELLMVQRLLSQYRETESRNWDAFVPLADHAIHYFELYEADLADHAEKRIDRQVAQARYGFWRD